MSGSTVLTSQFLRFKWSFQKGTAGIQCDSSVVRRQCDTTLHTILKIQMKDCLLLIWDWLQIFLDFVSQVGKLHKKTISFPKMEA